MARGMWIGIGGKLTNMLSDGSFESSLGNHGTATTQSTFELSTDKAKFGSKSKKATIKTTSTSNIHMLLHNFDATTNHIYYMVGYFDFSKATGVPRITFSPPDDSWTWLSGYAVGTASTSGWQRLSVYYKNTSYTGLRARWCYLGGAVGDVMYMDGCFVIDLTAVYGSGKEPTKEWCDQNLDFSKVSAQQTAGVARKTKNWWLGIDGSGYRYISNVSIGDSINIGGDLFTVIHHSYTQDGWTGQTLLWAETSLGQAKWTDILEWSEETGTDSAYNSTISDLAIKNGAHYKFRVLNDHRYLTHDKIRKVNGTAVNHWMADTYACYELVEEITGSEGEWVGPSIYTYGPYLFYYWNTSGTKTQISCGGSGDEDIDPVYPGASHYYFYACEVNSLTKVTYNANKGYWELFS